MTRNYIKKKAPAYTTEELNEAIEAVRSTQKTLYRASNHYKLPKPTLFKRVKGL